MNLPPQRVEQILARLGLRGRPEPSPAGLAMIYRAWCRSVPFDNVRKLIQIRSGNSGPLPGITAEDFFSGWLKHGTGGTCWSGAGALHALLSALGFNAARGIATMLVVPDLPPNHGTVMVTIGETRFLVDSAILHSEPLRLESGAETRLEHPAWGVRCGERSGRWHVQWRPLHRVEGFECRLESFGAGADDYRARYENTRSWSPFNFEVTARINRNDTVVGMAFGHSVTLTGEGGVSKQPISHQERLRLLVEDVGLSEEIVSALPEDVPTPPPPWSATAQARG